MDDVDVTVSVGDDGDGVRGDAPAAAEVVAAGSVMRTLAGLARSADHVPLLPQPEQVALLRDLIAAKDLLSSITTQVGAAVEKSGAWRTSGPAGARDYTDWLGRLSRTGVGAAKAQTAKQTVLTAMPTWKDASAETGSGVTDAHVGAVARVMEGAAPETKRRLVEMQAELAQQARATDATSFAKQLRAQAAAWEADAADAAFEQAHQARFLRLTATKGSVRLEGSLDPVAGETVRLALEALTPVPSAEDGRLPDQRRADALTDLAIRALGYGQKKGAQLRPTITVLMREETFLAARARQHLAAEAAERADRSANSDGSADGADGARGAAADSAVERSHPRVGHSGESFRRSGLPSEPALAELENRATLAPAAVEVLLCDAFVRRLVLDPAGQPLDVGLAERTFTGALRAAILTRDRHCQWPGCTLRASWCEIHHIQHWKDNGRTSLGNGIAACSFHHHLVHRNAVRITPVRGGFVFTYPDGTRIGESSRLADHLLVPPQRAGHAQPDHPGSGAASGLADGRPPPGVADPDTAPERTDRPRPPE